MQITRTCGSGGFEPRAWRPLAKGHGSSYSSPSHKQEPEKAQEAVRKRMWGHFQPALFSLLTVLVGGEREWEGQRGSGPVKGTEKRKELLRVAPLRTLQLCPALDRKRGPDSGSGSFTKLPSPQEGREGGRELQLRPLHAPQFSDSHGPGPAGTEPPAKMWQSLILLSRKTLKMVTKLNYTIT